MFRARTLRQLAARPARPRRALVGFDGFVDSIVAPVGLRRGPGEDFTPIATLAELGARISAAAGMSTNLELHPRGDKLGGNGPIMANALLALGSGLTYVGALGRPAVHPVFADLAARARVFSLAEAAHTLAVECRDGKLMLGRMRRRWTVPARPAGLVCHRLARRFPPGGPDRLVAPAGLSPGSISCRATPRRPRSRPSSRESRAC